MKNQIIVIYIVIIILCIVSLCSDDLMTTPMSYIIADSITDIKGIGKLTPEDHSQLASKIRDGYRFTIVTKILNFVILVVSLYGVFKLWYYDKNQVSGK